MRTCSCMASWKREGCPRSYHFQWYRKKNKLIWIVFLIVLWEMSNLYLPKQLNSERLTSPNSHLSEFNSTYMVMCLWLTQRVVLPVSWNAAFENCFKKFLKTVSLAVSLNWKLPHRLHKIGSDFKQGYGHGPAGKALKSFCFCCPQKNQGHMAQPRSIPSPASPQ